MEIELIEIRDFLVERHPFDALSDQTLEQLPKSLQIRYLRRDSHFPPEDIDGSYLYIIRSGAIELYDADDNLIEKLAEGDIYTLHCQLLDLGQSRNGKAVEDSLLYLLPCDSLRQLREGSEAFNRHFSESLRDRLKQAVNGDQESHNQMAHLTVEVSDLLKKPPVTIDVNASIQQAAQLMSKQNVSSVMLMEGEKLAGLITDRDLRKRCVATGLLGDRPAREIMSSQLQTVQHNSLVMHALMTMTRLNLHHLPVMIGEVVIGMLTATDLAQQQNSSSAFIANDVRKAQNLEYLIQASQRLPELQLQLANSSATAQHIGEAISCITDGITIRLIEMAQQELGPAPIPFVWLCGGSQARGEQSSHSDQDNALLLDDSFQPAQHADYFAALAQRVTDGLDACGFVYCPGDAMASNPKWRQPLQTWRGYFKEWIDAPEPMALMLSSIFFDLRPVFGEFSLFEQLQQEILQNTKGNSLFTAYMAANALQFRPPLGFFRNFTLIHGGEHDDTFDIKHRGIVPITDIARVFALDQGLAEVNTSERLSAAMAAGAISEEMGENLQDALEYIASLRIQHQAAQIKRGQSPNNYLPPDTLSELQRRHLKDAFGVIQTMQETMESRYQSRRFR